MASERFPFTSERIKAFPLPPAGKRAYAYDHGPQAEKGLGLAVTAAGARTFFWHGRAGGRPVRVTLGRFPDISVAQARGRALRARNAATEGRDPRKAVTPLGLQRTGAVTLGAFWAIYVEDYAKANRERWEVDDREFRSYAADLLPIQLDALTIDAVRAWHRALGQMKGGPTANRQLNTLRAVLNKAMVWQRPEGGPYATTNVAAADGVPRFTEHERDRFLQADELAAFFGAIAGYENAAARHFFQLALYTGARKSSIMSMNFGDIDMSNWIWTIPRPAVKGKKRAHPVPLVKQAQYIIGLRREFYTGPWVFPGARRDGRHVVNVGGWWNAIRKAGGLHDVVIHDLRRTLASWMAMTGASLPIIAQMLGHSLPGVTQIYARLSVEPVREAAQAAVDKIMEVAGVED